MKTISQLSPEEQKHFIQCECGNYIDMRDLSEVFNHMHAELPPAEWSHSVRKGDTEMHTRKGSRLGLN